jgi:hypothetical protein
MIIALCNHNPNLALTLVYNVTPTVTPDLNHNLPEL